MSGLPWTPRPDAASPAPWSPTMELNIEAIPDEELETVMYDPQNAQAYIAAGMGAWSDCPE